jgi:hypothetical protein
VVGEKEPNGELVLHDIVPVGFTPVTVAVHVTGRPEGAVDGPQLTAVVDAAGGMVTLALPELGVLIVSPE